MSKNAGQFSAKDIAGFKTGTLTALYPTGESGSGGYKVWRCSCACGNTIDLPTNRITNPRQAKSSCGCLSLGRQRKPNGESHYRNAWTELKKTCKERGLVLGLAYEHFRALITSRCHYCGEPPALRPVAYLKESWPRNGIDRVDSSLGYLPTNCVPCCTKCNVAKLDHSFNDFKEWVGKVYRHLYDRD